MEYFPDYLYTFHRHNGKGYMHERFSQKGAEVARLCSRELPVGHELEPGLWHSMIEKLALELRNEWLMRFESEKESDWLRLSYAVP